MRGYRSQTYKCMVTNQTQCLLGEMIRSANLIVAMIGMMFANAAPACMQEIKVSNNQLGLQLITLNMDYAEKDDAGVLLDTEKGTVSGTNIFLPACAQRTMCISRANIVAMMEKQTM